MVWEVPRHPDLCLSYHSIDFNWVEINFPHDSYLMDFNCIMTDYHKVVMINFFELVVAIYFIVFMVAKKHSNYHTSFVNFVASY